jgi:CubicO group peptidase (beta-lactamase class C family)
MPKVLALLLAATVLCASACTDDVDSPPGEPESSRNTGCDPALDEVFREWADAGFSGTIAITTADEVTCEAAYGEADPGAGTPNTPGTVFGIGSITKAFTAAAIYDLVDEGVLSLDDRAGDLVPALTGPVADATVQLLLLHTSGITGSIGEDHEPLSKAEAVAALSQLEQVAEPGAEYLYSNAGYSLLALIIEQTSGMTYREHTMAEILTPEGASPAGGFWDGEPAAPGPRAVGTHDDGSTGVDGSFAGPHWALEGNGALAMTVPELAEWTRALFTGEVVSPASAEAIATPSFHLGADASETPGWVAFDRSRFGEPVIASAGGGGEVGHNAVVAWLPDSQRVVAMASNRWEITAEDLLQEIAPALVAGDPLPRPEGADPLQDDEGDEDLDPEEVAEHEALVLELLAGETQAGRQELELLEEELGLVGDVELVGTVSEDGELRTYVTLEAEDGPTLAWYAVDGGGGVQAVEITDDLPAELD